MNKTVMRLILGIMLAGWMIIIFWFSNQPATESSEISGTISYRLVEDTDEIFNWGLTTDQIGNIAGNIEYPIRKAAHMTEYAILGWLAFAFSGTFEMRQKVHYIAALGFAFCYASTDEFHQLFIPGRSDSLRMSALIRQEPRSVFLLLAILLKIGRRHCAKSAHTLQ